MRKIKTFICCVVVASAISGCSQDNAYDQLYEPVAYVNGDISSLPVDYIVHIHEDADTALGCSNSNSTVAESWTCAYQYRQIALITLGADNVFVSGLGVKLPADILPDNIYDIHVKHMGDIDSVMALAIWDSAEEAEKLLFSGIGTIPIFLVLELSDSDGNVLGHSLTNSPIYNAITHECYLAEIEGVEWKRIWSPTNASAQDAASDSRYELKQIATLFLRADNSFASGEIAILPDDISDNIYSAIVKHVGDINSIMALDIWDSVADAEKLLFQRGNAIPVYVVLEFIDSDGDVLGHSLVHRPTPYVTDEWHTAEIDEIKWGRFGGTANTNSWHSMCTSCCVENYMTTNSD